MSPTRPFGAAIVAALLVLTISCAGGLSRGRVVQLQVLPSAESEERRESVARSRALDILAKAWADEEDVLSAWQELGEGLVWVAHDRESEDAKAIAALAMKRLAIVAPGLERVETPPTDGAPGLYFADPASVDGAMTGVPALGGDSLVVASLETMEVDGEEAELGVLVIGEGADVAAAVDYVLTARRSGRLPDRAAFLAGHGFRDDRFTWVRVSMGR